MLHHGKFGNRALSIYEKNILVTGATGLLGSHFSSHLLNNNCEFTALAIEDSYSSNYVNSFPKVEVNYVDIANFKELIECFPKTIAAQTFDYSAVNQQQKVSVTFSYRYWKNLTDEARLPKSLADSLETLARNVVVRQLRSRIPALINRLTR